MEFTDYIRKPFKIQATLITEENIEEVSKIVGVLGKKDDGTPYIQVNPRKIPNVERVYTGFWLTKMGNNYRCYSGRAFEDQFVKTSDRVEDGVLLINTTLADLTVSDVT